MLNYEVYLVQLASESNLSITICITIYDNLKFIATQVFGLCYRLLWCVSCTSVDYVMTSFMCICAPSGLKIPICEALKHWQGRGCEREGSFFILHSFIYSLLNLHT